MPQLLDIILLVIMAISGLLALMRGFTREVLSFAAWGIAGLAALGAILSPGALNFVKGYIEQPLMAKIALGVGVFIIVLIIVSLLSMRLADWVLDSSAGPLDRSAGLIYGLVRGLLLVVIAYLFYVWLLPRDKHEEWVKNAVSLPVIEQVGGVIISFLPEDIASTLRGQHYGADNNTDEGAAEKSETNASEDDDAYKQSDQKVLDQLIESGQSQ